MRKNSQQCHKANQEYIFIWTENDVIFFFASCSYNFFSVLK